VRKVLLLVAVVGLISSPGRSAHAQAQAPPFAQSGNAARHGIGVVDISFIFKNYPQFTQQIETLKREMEAADGALKGDRDKIVAMEEQRNALKPGSVEFKQLDEQLAQQKAAFSIKQGTVRRDFLEREAQIYYQTYSKVSEAVATYSKQNNVGLVLRFNGDDIDASQREDVMRAIMQPIVYQNSVDITPDVLWLLGVDARKLKPEGSVAPVAARPQAGAPQGGFQR